MDIIQRIALALRSVVCHPDHNEAKIREFFSPDYQQIVDGQTLDFTGFVEHMARLKHLTHAIDVTVVAIAGQNNNVLTHHRVAVSKKDGTQAHIDVFAHFTLENGLITRCEELTRLVQGTAQDRSLGSVR
ncbi:nuclear transport factor 2 family protein [Kosakonia pseudosacchari]|uniref:nuclear transport factor 2 family protein n=1 Tax=Kosakonia pseudosacchari TaxID=1646340 RepID=UPI0022F08E61|nr:nuclear transport factor 2 family protein [Kosakonia pseudosacchari]WBU49909.1 nuclear transport factor 2 family protein [Kosakonia pseudosacchari]